MPVIIARKEFVAIFTFLTKLNLLLLGTLEWRNVTAWAGLRDRKSEGLGPSERNFNFG